MNMFICEKISIESHGLLLLLVEYECKFTHMLHLLSISFRTRVILFYLNQSI